MSRLDSLPPDLSAVLSLLLRRDKRHAEVAGMLGIQERTVHDRAHAALTLLAPGQARALTAEQRELLGEYLLGQQDAGAESQSRALLEGSAAARAWAQALASALAPLSSRPLSKIAAAPTAASTSARRAAAPDRPAGAREPASASTDEPAPSAPNAPRSPREAQPSSSRVGGAVILGALALVAIVVVLLIVGIGGGGGGSHTGSQPSASATTAGTDTTSTAGASTTGTAATAPASTGTTSSGASPTSHGKALTLTPPAGTTSKAVGVAYVLSQKGQHAFYVFAKGLPALPSGSFYAVWLEGAATAAPYPLGSLPAAGANGLVEGGGPLPTDAASYSRIIVTTETTHHPSHPGPTALGGAFALS